MTTILPPFPRFVMTIFEPLSTIAGAVAPFISAEYFVTEQIPLSANEPLSANARMVAYQLGNCYLLLAMMSVAILYTTQEPKVVRNYVIALWLADISHVFITCYIMEYKRVVDVANWNAMAWGNIGATTALFTTRTAYLLGLFGPDRLPPSSVSSKKSL